MNGSTAAVLILFVVLLGSGMSGLSFDRLSLDEEEVGTVLSVAGDAAIRRGGTVTFVSIADGDSIPSGATLRTGRRGQVVISLLSGERIQIEPDTDIYFDSSVLSSGVESVVLNVEQGGVKLQSKAPALAARGLQNLVRSRSALQVRSGQEILATRDESVALAAARLEIKLDNGKKQVIGDTGAFQVASVGAEKGGPDQESETDPFRFIDVLVRQQERKRSGLASFIGKETAALEPKVVVVPHVSTEIEKEAPLNLVAPVEAIKPTAVPAPVKKQRRELRLLALAPWEKQGFIPVIFDTPLPKGLVLGGGSPVQLVAQASGRGWVSRLDKSELRNLQRQSARRPLQFVLEDEGYTYNVSITEPDELRYPVVLRMRRTGGSGSSQRPLLPGRYLRLVPQFSVGANTLDLRVMRASDLQGILGNLLGSAAEGTVVEGTQQLSGRRHIFAKGGQVIFEAQGDLKQAEVKSLAAQANDALHYEGKQVPKEIKSLTADDYARLWAEQSEFVRLECAGKERWFPRAEFLARNEVDIRAMLRDCQGIIFDNE
jgi:hypothetical protein